MLPRSGTMRAVRQTALGASDTLSFTHQASFPTKPSENSTLIKVQSAALNRADLLMRSGGYPNQNGKIINLGLEVAGVDVETGKNVMALLGNGGYAEYVYVPKEQVMDIPENVDLKVAAAIPEVWLTAWQLITFVAGMKPETSSGSSSGTKKVALIHGGASGVGTAASQICSKILNMTVITTVGSDQKMEASKNFGADFSINYKSEPNWPEKVHDLTDNHGADLILDCIGGSYFEKNLNSLAIDGKWVLYGFLGGVKISDEMVGKFLPTLLKKRGNLLASLLNARSAEYKAELVKDFSEKVLPKFGDNSLTPVVDSVFDMEKVVEAHNYMATNQNIGKILLTFDHEQK